jgi:hypothetical protein
VQDPALVIVNALLKAGDEAGLKSTERYEKDSHYQATLWRTADVAVAALGIEPAGSGEGGEPVFRLNGLADPELPKP